MAAQPVPGASFGEYEILAELGSGGMGRVLRARHVALQREVALKVLGDRFASDESYRQRFLKEARAAARLNHPNIVQIYDFGRVDSTFYIAMEFVRGESVGDRLRRSGSFPEADAVAIVRQAGVALRVAHEAGIVHRDVKPDNLILSVDGVVKLVDLGLAKSIADDANLTQTGIVSGTPHYISPEQIAGLRDIDGRADIYSLGATLFHMVTGRTPFEGTSAMMIVARHLHDDPADPREFAPGASAGVCAVIRRMMAKNRDQRYPDMSAAVADLLVLESGRTTGAQASAPAVTVVEAALEPTPTPGRGWDAAVLARIERSLAAAIGPMAKVLVRRERQRASDVAELSAALAEHIPSEPERRAFIADAGRTEKVAETGREAAVPRALSGTEVDPAPSGRPPKPESSAGIAWNQEALRAVERRLADSIGPVAKVLVQKASRTAKSWDALIAALAAAVPADQQAAFLADARSIAR